MKSLEVDKRVEAINENGKEAKGRRELIRHFYGERNTIRQMVLAKCYDCMGYFSDGKDDCGMELCPLYPIMAYRSGEKYATKTLSAEHREKLSKSRSKSKTAVSTTA
jgi:hypothetical protein